jgi:hypothetical protein
MKKYPLLLLLIGTVIMIIVMTKTGAVLKTAATPKGILDLEFAYDSATTATVITAWQSPGADTYARINAAVNNTYLDFIFLIFYALFLFFTCEKIARLSAGSFGKMGWLIAKASLLAGGLDVLENTGMLYNLSGNISNSVALFTTTCSVIKWVLALTAVLYCIAGIVYVSAKGKGRLLLA